MLVNNSLLDLLFRLLNGCEPSDGDGVPGLRFGREPTRPERELLDKSEINLVFEYTADTLWVVAETDGATLMMPMAEGRLSGRVQNRPAVFPASPLYAPAQLNSAPIQ